MGIILLTTTNLKRAREMKMFIFPGMEVSNVFPGKAYWEEVWIQHDRDEKQLKEMILSENTGIGVVAALIATISVSALLVAPATYNQVRMPDPIGLF